MSARHPAQARHGTPVSRAERRAAERAADRTRRHARRGTNPWSLILGTVILVVALGAFAVAALSGFAMHQSGTTTPVPRALTDPAALDPAPHPPSIGSVAPAFSLTDPAGVRYTLAGEKGHPVLLEFFAVWCPVCQRETGIMHRLAATYGPKGVTTLAVLANPYGKNFETSGHRDLSLATVRDLAWYHTAFTTNYPLLVDPRFRTVNAYGVGAYPGLYVIGSDGRIRLSASGFHTYSAVAAALNKALK